MQLHSLIFFSQGKRCNSTCTRLEDWRRYERFNSRLSQAVELRDKYEQHHDEMYPIVQQLLSDEAWIRMFLL